MALAMSTMEQYSDLQKEIILLVDIDDVPVNGTLKLQKMVYFLSVLVEKVKEHGFKPGIYGPHSILVEQELQHMIKQGVLSMDDDKISTTSKGKEIFDDIIKETAMDIVTKWCTYVDLEIKDAESYFRETLSEYKDMINDLSRDELLSYIYCDAPDMISDRIEYELLKPNFEKHIISMAEKEKFTTGRGAELLGKTINYMRGKVFVDLSVETYPPDSKI